MLLASVGFNILFYNWIIMGSYPTSRRREQLLLWGCVLLTICAQHLTALQSSTPPPTKSKLPDGEKPNPVDVEFYKSCEGVIRREVEAFSESDLQKEEKLTRIRRSNGTSYFYLYKKPLKGKHIFVWTPSKQYLTSSSVNSLVIGITNQLASPFGWLSGSFIALRKVNSSDHDNQTHYYAMVAYARKDGNGILLEWDRWSPSLGKGLESRSAYINDINSISIIRDNTLLCAYGTCSCNACGKCINRTGPSSSSLSAESEEDEGGKVKAQRKSKSGTISLKGKKFNNNMLKDADAVLNTSDSSESSNRGRSSSAAITKNQGNADADSKTHEGSSWARALSQGKGKSMATSSSNKDALSESGSNGGTSTSIAKSKSGFSQASSQSNGGNVLSIAGKSGGDQYDYDKDDDLGGDDEEEMDAMNLFQETEQAFQQAAKRTNFVRLVTKGDISRDMCFMEHDIMEQMNRLELAALLKRAIAGQTTKKARKASRIAIRRAILYKDPLRFGIDVDGCVNKSIVFSSNTSGYTIKRDKCCGLSAEEESTDIMKFLKTIGQNCAGSLKDLVEGLKKFNYAMLKKLMQIKKLTASQHRELVSMVIMRAYEKKQNLARSVDLITELFKNAPSEKITIQAAILVNAAYYTTTKAKMHRVKVFKGLGENAYSIWTGVLLEYKKCMHKPTREGKCSESFKERLDIEMNLALGVYLFLKFADVRYSIATVDGVEPADVFVSFLQLHNLSIAKQVFCKSKRMVDKK